MRQNGFGLVGIVLTAAVIGIMALLSVRLLERTAVTETPSTEMAGEGEQAPATTPIEGAKGARDAMNAHSFDINSELDLE